MNRKEILEMINQLYEEMEEGVKYPKEYTSKLNIILNELKANLEL